MAVFQQEMNWGKFQADQMRVLDSINRSFERNMRLSDAIYSKMSSTDSVLHAIALASESSAANVALITKELIGYANEFKSTLAQANDSAKELADTFEEAGDAAKKSGGDLEDKGKELGDSATTFKGILKDVATNLWNHLGGLRGIGAEVNKFSEASNTMLKLSGMSGQAVKEFRSEIMSTVQDLNSVTGYAYNPSEAYNQIISISQGVTSNLEAIQEMARPLLLAQESLDVNISGVADIFNKFYTRYSFSSSNMESVLNEIRGNTAGNSATAEATMENIKALETWISYIAKDNNDKREDMLKEISHYTSWLESMNMDSSPYTKYIKDIAYGDWANNRELLNILNRAGLSAKEAQEMVKEGQWEEITVAITEGIHSIMEAYGDSPVLGRILDNLNIDRETALDAYNAMNSKNFKTFEEFLENMPTKNTMAEIVEDKYVSLADKANNWLGQIYAKLADVQETLGIGFTDVATIYALLGGKNGLTSIVSLLTRSIAGSAGGAALGSAASGAIGGAASGAVGGAAGAGGLALAIGSTGNAMVGGSGLLGSLADKGYAMVGGAEAAPGLPGGVAAGIGAVPTILKAGGVAAGGVLAYESGSKAIEDFQNGDIGYGIGHTIGAVGGAVGAVGIGLAGTNPIGWAALAIGALAYAVTESIEAFTKVGAAEMVEAAYEEAAEGIREKSDIQIENLSDINGSLRRFNRLVEAGADEVTQNWELEQIRSKLINSGLLSEEDIELARVANAEGLQRLTDAYMNASKQWSTQTLIIMDKYEQLDIEYAKTFHDVLEDKLQEWNDGGYLEEGSEELEAVERLMYRLMKGLEERASAGEEFDEDTQLTYENMKEAFEDGKFTEGDANMIIDEGFWNTVFQNTAFKAEDLIQAAQIMGGVNTAGQKALDSIIEAAGGDNFRGAELTSQVADVLSQITSGLDNGTLSIDSAQKKLDSVKQYKRLFSEIEDIAMEYGLSAYAEGTNYVARDQIALIHEGEAVVPKKYNPAANTSEIRELAQEIADERRESARESQELKSYIVTFVSELQEIKTFLSGWKEDNIRRERTSEAKSKFDANRTFMANYMNVNP